MGERKLPVIYVRFDECGRIVYATKQEATRALVELDTYEPAVGRCKTCDAFYAYQEPRYAGLGYCARGLSGINGDGSDYCSKHHPKPEETG